MYKSLKDIYVKVYNRQPEVITEFENNEIIDNIEKVDQFLSDGYDYYVFMNDSNKVYEFDNNKEDLICELRQYWGQETHINAFINANEIHEIGGKKYKIIFDTDYFDVYGEEGYMYVDEEIECMNEYFAEVYEGDRLIYVAGHNLDWRGSSGYKIIRDMDKIFTELLPSYDARTVVYQNIEDKKDIFINRYSHDVPTGSLLELVPIIDMADVMSDMSYEYSSGDKKGSSLQEFLRDFTNRTKIPVDDSNIEFDYANNAFYVFEGEIIIYVKDDLTTVDEISYDADYLEERLIKNM